MSNKLLRRFFLDDFSNIANSGVNWILQLQIFFQI